MTQIDTSGTGPTFDFNTQELWANYSRVMPDWTATVRGGGTLIEPASKAFAVGAVTFQTSPERSTFVQLDLSRKAAPSFFFVGGAMISNVGQVLINHRLSKRLMHSGAQIMATTKPFPIGPSSLRILPVRWGSAIT